MLRRLGNDVVFDIATDSDGRVTASEQATLERNGVAILLKRAPSTASLTVSTERIGKSRCYCIVYAIRTADPLRLEIALSSLVDNNCQPAVRAVDMPSAGYYCGIVELNKNPVRAANIQIVFANATSNPEIFDLFAVAYG
jgi:hypothetical protein